MKYYVCLFIYFFSLCTSVFSNSSNGNYLYRKGNKLYDNSGKEVRLTGVNWFGFETSLLVFHGLWSRDYKSMLKQIKDVGFNCVRIPWCNKMLEAGSTESINSSGTDPFTNQPMNQDLAGLTPIEVLDKTIEECGRLGLKVILDNHSRAPDAYMVEYLWYIDKYPHKKWIEDWVFLAKRYRGNDAVIGMDLNNEPHNNNNNIEFAAWGSGDPKYDWKMAAEECGNAILRVNPDVLIIIEGVQRYKQYNYWWGGNLIGVKDHPVKLIDDSKLVYSPHEYGPEVHLQPWYQDTADFPANMKGIWDRYFGYIYDENIAPLLIGEFGIARMSSFNGKAGIWFDHFLKYMAGRYSWTFWCWNPNSGDTGGILNSDWKTLTKWKIDKLKPYFAPMIKNSSEIVNINRKSKKRYQSGLMIQSFSKNDYKTKVQYSIPNSGTVDITVYNAKGNVLYKENRYKKSGSHYVILDKSIVNSGIYFIKLQTGNFNLIHKYKFTTCDP